MTTTITPHQLLTQLQWRYATKQFDPAKKIPAETWSTLEDALVLTPSSFGLQPWKFIVITDPVLRQKLVPVSWNQTQPVDCSHFVVFAVQTALTDAHIDGYLQHMAGTRGMPVEKLASFRDMLTGFAQTPGFNAKTWATYQAYIALGNFMTAAALLGVDTCPMEGIVPAKYDELLDLPRQGLATVVACAAGYRAASDKYAALKKVRYSKQQVITHI